MSFTCLTLLQVTLLVLTSGCICTQNTTEVHDGISKENGQKTLEEALQKDGFPHPQKKYLPATDARRDSTLTGGLLQTDAGSFTDRGRSAPPGL